MVVWLEISKKSSQEEDKEGRKREKREEGDDVEERDAHDWRTLIILNLNETILFQVS